MNHGSYEIVKAELVQYNPRTQEWRTLWPPKRVKDIRKEFDGVEWQVIYPREDDEEGYTHIIWSYDGPTNRYYLAKIVTHGGWVGKTTKREDQ